MNVRDIEATFGKIQEAMASQRNVILTLQKDVTSLKKDLADANGKIEELTAALDSRDQDSDDDVEVVEA